LTLPDHTVEHNMISTLELVERVCFGYRDKGKYDGKAKECEGNPSRFRDEHGVAYVRW